MLSSVLLEKMALNLNMQLNNDEIRRYSRHLILPEVGIEGQVKLKDSKVLLVGTGGLGAPLALYLAAAGVGTLGLVDFDTVDSSNLQRQVIHGTSDIGRKKLDSAEDSVRELNPNVRVVRHEVALSSENAMEIIAQYDVVADGSRFLILEHAHSGGEPVTFLLNWAEGLKN